MWPLQVPQVPFEQNAPVPVHTCPQLPQLFGSLAVAMHVPPQLV
jgi:hypothetical protein